MTGRLVIVFRVSLFNEEGLGGVHRIEWLRDIQQLERLSGELDSRENCGTLIYANEV